MTLLARFRAWLRARKRRRLRDAMQRQRRDVSRIELQFRAYQAERMAEHQAKARAREKAQSTRQLDAFRQRLEELEHHLRTIRPGLQLLAAEEAAARAREVAVSDWGDFDDAAGGVAGAMAGEDGRR